MLRCAFFIQATQFVFPYPITRHQIKDFCPYRAMDNDMALISQGAASLALGYGSLLGFHPAIIITDSNKRPEGANAERT